MSAGSGGAGGGGGRTRGVLSNRVFRALLTVQLVNAIAVWIHVVAVQWVLTARGESAFVISLAPAALAVPFIVLSMPVGVVAGFASRKKLMAGATTTSALAAGTACVLSLTGADGALPMVASVLLVGTALVVVGVSWQSLLPETVDRASIPTAAVMDGAAFNVARAVGPLIAGIGLGFAGSAWTFGLVCALSAGSAIALTVSERRTPDRTAPRRAILPELAGALRFVAYSAWTTRLLFQLVLFGLPSSALWALISLVVHDRLGMGSDGFGVLMGLVGAGAVTAAFSLGGVRRRLRVKTFAALGALTYGAVLLVLATSTTPLVVGVAVFFAGGAWVSVQSTWMSMGHQFLPGWIRPRLIAFILLMFQGTQAAGSLLWGTLTDALGLELSLGLAAAILLASAVSLVTVGLGQETGLEPVLFAESAGVDEGGVEEGGAAGAPDRARTAPGVHDGKGGAVQHGPLVVRYVYRVREADRARFTAAMKDLRRSRLRLGGSTWRLRETPDRPGEFVETYRVAGAAAFAEQERERLTVPEEALRSRVLEFVESVDGPELQVRQRS